MRGSLIVALVCAAALAPVRAFADVAPPNECACTGKNAGNPCDETINTCGGAHDAGGCVPGTCGRLDYQHWDRDAMPLRPPTITYACLICDTEAGTATSGDAASDAASDAAEPDGAGSSPDGGPSAPQHPTGGSGSSGGCNCNIGTADATRIATAWLLAAVVPLGLARFGRKPKQR